MENDRIAQRIIDDARTQAERTLAAARVKADKLTANAREEAARTAATEKARADADCKKLIERRATVARLDGKKEELRVKQELVSRVYGTALDKLCAMKKERYMALVERQIAKYAEDGDRVAIAADAPFAEKDLEMLGVFKDRGLTAVAGGAFRGGIIIEGKTADIDLSFSALVKAYADGRYDAARELFGDDN